MISMEFCGTEMETETKHLILVLESDPTQAQLISEVLAAGSYQVVTITSGHQALDFLHRRGEHEQAPRPDLILLDVDFPDEEGWTILADIKGDRHLRRIPTLVLTRSDHQSDVLKSYSLQGNSYLLKPYELDQLLQIVKRIEDFWLKIVTLPRE
jgi:two-component system, chemotaxis family, response regulator Rcp1